MIETIINRTEEVGIKRKHAFDQEKKKENKILLKKRGENSVADQFICLSRGRRRGGIVHILKGFLSPWFLLLVGINMQIEC